MSGLKHRLFVVCTMGILFGAGISLAYINPYDGRISFSELLLQVSGSRGSFALAFGMTELLAFGLRMVPGFIFELYMGIELYRFFCTASVYLFSRTPKRLPWYGKELGQILGLSFFYQLFLLAGEVLAAVLRYRVEFDRSALSLGLYHVTVFTLWVCGMTLLVNLAAFLLGSSGSFLLVAGVQFFLIALLAPLRMVQEDPQRLCRLLRMNPISHLVLGWHSSHEETLQQVLHSPYEGLYLGDSLAFMLVFCGICAAACAFYIVRYDLILSDLEV